MAPEMLSQRALIAELDEVEKQERRHREELEIMSKEREKELKEDKKTFARLKEAVRENRASQGTKRCTAEMANISRSGGRPKSNGSSQLRSPAHVGGK